MPFYENRHLRRFYVTVSVAFNPATDNTPNKNTSNFFIAKN